MASSQLINNCNATSFLKFVDDFIEPIYARLQKNERINRDFCLPENFKVQLESSIEYASCQSRTKDGAPGRAKMALEKWASGLGATNNVAI
jgi:hypothetical protein